MCVELKKKYPELDGIFCVTDTVAMGAMVGVKKLNLRVPEDVAVVGFSNWFMSQVVDPPLSSVSQPSLEMGKRAADLLLQEIQAQKNETEFVHEQLVLPTKLVMRASSGG